MHRATSTTAAGPDGYEALASPRYQDMLRQLKQADDLPSVLTGPDLNIADLVCCDAAAAALGGKAACVTDHLDGLVLQLADELDDAENSLVCIARHVTAAHRGTADVEQSWNILAVRFDRGESGWLFWFRRANVGTAHRTAWDGADLELAQRLRVDLMEICLERAGRYRQSQAQLMRKLAHDLANPLQSISMSASLLQAEGKRNRDLQRHITTAASKLQTVATMLQELGRLETDGLAVLEPTQTDLSALLKDMLQTTPEIAAQAQIEADVHAMVDQQRVESLLNILLDNAQRYRLPNSPVRVSLRQSEANLQLSVANQTDVTETALSNSTPEATSPDREQPLHSSQGMGLRLATAIARAHRGALQTSASNGWVRFTLSLPR